VWGRGRLRVTTRRRDDSTAALVLRPGSVVVAGDPRGSLHPEGGSSSRGAEAGAAGESTQQQFGDSRKMYGRVRSS
jgi:hypothetical protein